MKAFYQVVPPHTREHSVSRSSDGRDRTPSQISPPQEAVIALEAAINLWVEAQDVEIISVSLAGFTPEGQHSCVSALVAYEK